MVHNCYKCGETDKVMMLVHSPGTYYMCTDCIEKEENETGKVGVLFALGGLKFLNPEEYKELEKEN